MPTEQHGDAAPSVGERIRAVRERRGLSVRALAGRAG